MRINQFAQLTNLSAKTIRYYEDIGLLPPAHRLDNGYRDYDDTDVDKARFVAGARSLDFSLDDIQEILALREQREAPCRVVLDLLQEKAGEINRRVAELQRMEAELRELHRLGLTFPTDDVDGKNCICHLVSEHSESTAG
jgi:MerR family copper efflux transcriptional regulator